MFQNIFTFLEKKSIPLTIAYNHSYKCLEKQDVITNHFYCALYFMYKGSLSSQSTIYSSFNEVQEISDNFLVTQIIDWYRFNR